MSSGVMKEQMVGADEEKIDNQKNKNTKRNLTKLRYLIEPLHLDIN